MSHHLKAFQFDIFCLFRDTCFSFRNGNLLVYGINSFQIRKQKSPFDSFAYDNTVAFHIQLFRRSNFFRLSQNIHTVHKPVQFFCFESNCSSRVCPRSSHSASVNTL